MRRLLAIGAGLGLTLGLTTAAFAWDNITLNAECAPDRDSLAWSIDLPSEKNFKVDWSFDASFATFATVDFGSKGEHEFTTPRDGDTLHVRWASDTSVTAQAMANEELCVQGGAATPTPTQEGGVHGGTSQPTPEDGVQGATGTPSGIPDTAVTDTSSTGLPALLFGMLLIASLATLVTVNLKAARARV